MDNSIPTFTMLSTTKYNLLAAFKCPNLCLASNDLHRLLLETDCPFGHSASYSISSQSNRNLHTIPPWVCIPSLLEQCTNPVSTITGAGEQLPKCARGFHLQNEDLANFTAFSGKMATVLLSGAIEEQNTAEIETRKRSRIELKLELSASSKAAPKQPVQPAVTSMPSPSPECPVCLEPIDKYFGYVERCSHIFCGSCITRWNTERTRTNQQKAQCPVCRTTAASVLLWPQPLQSPEEKKHLFELQNQLFTANRRSTAPPHAIYFHNHPPNHPNVDETLRTILTRLAPFPDVPITAIAYYLGVPRDAAAAANDDDDDDGEAGPPYPPNQNNNQQGEDPLDVLRGGRQ